MDELLAGIGQCAEPATSGEHTVASAYAGATRRHILVLADGAAGPIPSRLAAQAAVSAVFATWRSREDVAVEDRLRAAFREAHDAVRRASAGSHAEGGAGASVAALVVEPNRVVVARLGGVRAYLVDGDQARILGPADPAEGFVGDGRTEARIATVRSRPAPGHRFVLATEATARPLVGDLEALCRGSSPQLVAHALVAASRRRGASGALGVQVLEIRSHALLREAHPAFARIDRTDAPTLDARGRRVRGLRRRSGRGRRGSAFLPATALVGFALGALTGWIHLTPPAPAPSDGIAAATSAPDALADAPTAADPPREPPAKMSPAEPTASTAPGWEDLFYDGSPEEAAAALEEALRRGVHAPDREILDEAEAWVRGHRSERVASVLVALLDRRPAAAVRKWLRDLLPTLLSEDDLR